MLFLKVVAFIFLVSGFGMVFLANYFVDRFGMDSNVQCDFEHEMNEEELKRYKRNKAVVNFKMLGLLVALPGIIMVIIIFR